MTAVAHSDGSAAGQGPSARRNGVSLRCRLVLLVLASVVPLFVFSLGHQYLEYRRDIAATGPRTLTLARSLSLLVEEELQLRIAALETLATSTALQEGDLDRFRPRAETVIAQLFPGSNILLLRPDGEGVMNTLVPPGAALPVRTHLESINQVLATGRPAVSNLFQGAATHRPVIAIDVPVKKSDGTIAYILSLNPRLEAFAEVVQRQHLPEGWVLSVFDRNGVNVARVPNGDRFLGHQASATLIGPLRAEHEGILETTSLEGIRLLTAFSHAQRFGWAVAIGVPREELTAPVVSGAIYTLAVGGVLLACGLVLAVYAARRIARPIESSRRLAAASHQETLPDLAPSAFDLRRIEVAGVLYAAEIERRRSGYAEVILRDGIETIPEGFSIYDDQDRLVMCNDGYRRLSGDSDADVVPGMRYEDILRAGVAKGRYLAAKGDEEEWIAARLREHRDPDGIIEQQLHDGRWALITKHRLSNGWIGGLRIDITALKVAQTALAESERLLRDAIDSISGGFLITDTEDRVVFFNRQMPRFYADCVETLRFGAAYRDFLWARVERGYYPGARGREEAWFAEALARHRDANNEVEVLLKDGRWLLVTERRMTDGGIAGVSLDITALKQADASLRQSEERFRKVVESVPNAIVMAGSGGIIQMVNAQAERIFGYKRGELLGRPIEMLLPERYNAKHARLREGFFAHPQTRMMGAGRDLYGARIDGSEFPVEVGISSIETEQGLLVLASIIDITERKQAEQRLLDAGRRSEAALSALKENEQQLHQAQRLAQMGSELRELRTGETVWSDESYRIFGVLRDTFVPTAENILRMVHPDDHAKILAMGEQIRRGVTPAPFEYRITRPDGSVRHIYRESELIKDEDGSPLYLAGMIHDVTDQRRTEEQLRQAQKMEAIGNLTGGLAHDFNNLLGIIIGNLDIARRRLGSDEELNEIVGEALEAAWRGADLTRRLLAFSRRQPLRPTRIDVNALVTDTVRLLRRVLGEDIEISLNLSADIWPIMADPAQLEASLANLATNARDAMPRGGRLIIATANRRLGCRLRRKSRRCKDRRFRDDRGQRHRNRHVGRHQEPDF
jgi:PAS domain S-box-containing protein